MIFNISFQVDPQQNLSLASVSRLIPRKSRVSSLHPKQDQCLLDYSPNKSVPKLQASSLPNNNKCRGEHKLSIYYSQHQPIMLKFTIAFQLDDCTHTPCLLLIIKPCPNRHSGLPLHHNCPCDFGSLG